MSPAEFALFRQAIPADEVAARALQATEFGAACVRLDDVRRRIVLALLTTLAEDNLTVTEALDLIAEVSRLLDAD